MSTETGQILATLLAGLVPVLLAGAAWLRSEFALRQAKAEAERARLEREAAQDARIEAVAAYSETVQARNEVQALGAALGASFERSSGAPPQQE